MSGAKPEERVRVPAGMMNWEHVTFVHFPYDADVVQALLPRGLRVDSHDGVAWVSITPLCVTDMRAGPLLPTPTGATAEVNVRTYVRAPDERDGLFFFSLDATSVALVTAGRSGFGAPYKRAEGHAEVADGVARYQGRRTSDRNARWDIEVKIGDALRPNGLDHWLTGRWRAYTRHAGRVLRVGVEHGPWPLREARLARCEQTLLSVAGLPDPEADPLVHYSPGVDDVKFALPRPVG